MIMNIKLSYIVLGIVLCLTACNPGDEPSPQTKALAFPSAQGGGCYTTGGRGGYTLHVTTLEDDADNPGSLRYLVNMSGTRTIVFDVSGTIHLKTPLTIIYGSVTIAGQTAPGDGICLADYPLVITANNVIVRFLRVRLGSKGTEQTEKEYDAVSVNNSTNVILDHLSCSWSIDECVSCYGNTDFTLQYCFITESLCKSKHAKGDHGYGGIWGGTNASFHHNLLAHHDSRNPRFDHDYVNVKCAGPIDFVNNVVYNWGRNSAYGGEGSTKGAGGRHINFVNNYYKPGPATKSGVKTRLVDPWTSCDNCIDGSTVLPKGGTVVPPKIYLIGNTMTSSSDVTADNWKGSTKSKSVAGVDTRWTQGLTMLTKEQNAADAYETVLAKAGCSLHRDVIDTRIVGEVRNGTYTYKGSNGSTNGLIDAPSDVGGYPTLKSKTPPADTDRDGMPDEWEDANGLNKNYAADAKLYTLDQNYTNLEIYLNGLVQDLF